MNGFCMDVINFKKNVARFYGAKLQPFLKLCYKIPLALISRYLLMVSKVRFSGWVSTE